MCRSVLLLQQQQGGAIAAAAAGPPAVLPALGSNPASPLGNPKGSEATSAVSDGTAHHAEGGTITQSTALLSVRTLSMPFTLLSLLW